MECSHENKKRKDCPFSQVPTAAEPLHPKKRLKVGESQPECRTCSVLGGVGSTREIRECDLENIVMLHQQIVTNTLRHYQDRQAVDNLIAEQQGR